MTSSTPEAKVNEDCDPVKEKSQADISDISQREISFDYVLESIGSYGKFQKRFDITYNLIFAVILTAPYLNIILSLSIPDHWCHVPGRENTNLTLEAWRELNLPKEVNPSTKSETYSSCKMFTVNKTVVSCQHGYEYDRKWWQETTVSYENWVCEKDLYVTNAFVAGRIGEIIGTVVFGLLGDTLGRRPVFYISIVFLVIGRTASVFTSHWYFLFLTTILIGSLATTSIYQSPIVISMEIASLDQRSNVAFMSCVGWVAGLCLLDFIAWLSRDWTILMLATTLPALTAFFTYRFLPESPRWLASRGQIEKAVKTLEYICEVNKTKLPANTEQILQKLSERKEKYLGVASLFTSWRLARNTVIIVSCWVFTSLSYYILMLNVTNMAGDPFLNFFWQSIAELPGYIAGRVFGDKLGRRWTHSGTYIVSATLCFSLLFVPSDSIFTTVMTSLVKVCVTCSFYMVWLQAMEVFPTCVRQIGSSFGGTMANIAGILGPYVVYVGTADDGKFPFIVLCLIALIGATISSFLPETNGRKLPETLEEAHVFGQEDSYFSFNNNKKNQK